MILLGYSLDCRPASRRNAFWFSILAWLLQSVGSVLRKLSMVIFFSVRTLDQEGVLSHLRIMVLFLANISPPLSSKMKRGLYFFATWNSNLRKKYYFTWKLLCLTSLSLFFWVPPSFTRGGLSQCFLRSRGQLWLVGCYPWAVFCPWEELRREVVPVLRNYVLSYQWQQTCHYRLTFKL